MAKQAGIDVIPLCVEGKTRLKVMATAKLPTKYANFKIVAFCNDFDGKEHIAVVKGIVAGKQNVPTRLHSECLTGDVLGSMRCECGQQLEGALEFIANKPCGILLYLKQEGRGVGLSNKIKAYNLQDQGLDTEEANEALGLPGDARDYEVAALMLRALKVKSVILLTNNPNKVRGLLAHGVKITKKIPLEVKANKYNAGYLRTKKEKFGHTLRGKWLKTWQRNTK